MGEDAGRADEAPDRASSSQLISPARLWLQAAAQRAVTWIHKGEIALPGGVLVVGDPMWSDGYFLEAQQPVAAERFQIWLCHYERDPLEVAWSSNAMLWLEASGALPTTTGASSEFSVDAAFFAIADLADATALVEFSRVEEEAGGCIVTWFQPANFAHWLAVPPGDHRIFLTSTREDDTYAAVQLHGSDDTLSGVLIDILGRESDGSWIDTVLPAREG